MQFKYDFLPQGAKVSKEGDKFIFKDRFMEKEWDAHSTVILDTGNGLEPGIVDHHHPDFDLGDSCVASIMSTDAERFIGHLKDLDEVTIVTHFVPDLDAIGSVYFTQKFLLGQKIDDRCLMLADYILEVDSGKLSIDPDSPVSIASVWLAVTNQDTDKMPFQRDNEGITLKGIEFLNKIEALLANTPSPWDAHLLDELKGFDDEVQRILEDKKVYYEDVKERSSMGIISIYNQNEGGFDEVDSILTAFPKSFLWKYWVRGDKVHSKFNNGFPITCAHWEKRSIIAVDPNMPYSLKGLGLLIDRMDMQNLLKTLDAETIESGPADETGKRPGPRPGFHRADPWYDGRGFHNFTIIDAPRAGSALSIKEIENAFFANFCWMSYGKKIDEIGESNITYDMLMSWDTPVESVSNDQIILEELGIDNYMHGVFQDQLAIQKNQSLMIRDDAFKRQSFINISNKFANNIAALLDQLDTLKFKAEKNDIVKNIIPVLSSEALFLVISNTRDLPEDAFYNLLSNCNDYLDKSVLLTTILELQSRHPHNFKNSEDSLNQIIEQYNIKRLELITILRFISIPEPLDNFAEEFPLYAFNKLKNYVDDVFICNELGKTKNLSEDLKSFISQDFESFFELDSTPEEASVMYENAKINLIFLKKHKIELFKSLFGHTYEKIRIERNLVLREWKGSVAKAVKKYGVDELIDLDFEKISEYIKNIEYNISDQQKDLKSFNKNYYAAISLIQKFSALEYLFNRNINYAHLNAESNNRDIFYGNPFIIEFNKLIYQLFYAISIYPNTNSSEIFEEVLTSTIDTLNRLRTSATEYDFLDTENLRELLLEFIPIILDEITLDVSDIDEQIQKSLDQYNLITKGEGIIEAIEQLPYFYRAILKDVFISFKRYYRERVNFFRKDLKYVSDLSESSEEEKSNKEYVRFYNYLINESIKFDWQELKDLSDASNDNRLIYDFYQKYFHWQNLNINKDEHHKLAELNSEIRFAEGDSASIEKIINNLPGPPKAIDLNEYIHELTFNWDIDNTIKHYPSQLINQTYDYLMMLYLNKFDVENVKESLLKYSTSFPWYYKWLTNKRIIQSIFIFFCVCLLSMGFFDPNVYELEEESFRTPIASFLYNNLGETIFMAIANILSCFWGIFLSLAFLLPFGYLFLLIINLFRKPKENNDEQQFKFLEIVASIEGKQNNLLYLSFIIPLLLVVMQMASMDTIELINNIEGFRLISTLIIIIGLTVMAVYMHVKEANPNRSKKWIFSKTEHMLWLHLLQALILTIFVIDLMLRFEISMDMFPSKDELVVLGISKYIEVDFGGFFDVKIMPVFTILVSLLTLFFSFFIDKVLGND